MLGSDPILQPFTYVFVPCDSSRAVETRTFNGTSDEELRKTLNDYFKNNNTLSVGQSQSFKEHMKEQIRKNAQKNEIEQPNDATKKIVEIEDEDKDGDDVKMKDAKTDPAANSAEAELLLNSAIHGAGGFEIVPVIYPTTASNFKGTSFYIDQVGAFKELPLNDRASKIAQRAIRGDAFMLCSIDDPRKDEWARVDCPLEHFNELLAHPPSPAPDPQVQAQMQQLQSQRKDISEADVKEAGVKKEEGNERYRTGKFSEGEERYTAAMDQISGNVPLPLKQSVGELMATCLLNRAACRLKLSKWSGAVQDCSLVLEVMPKNTKALFRRATAEMQQTDYDAAMEDCKKLVALSAEAGEDEPSAEVRKLQHDIKTRQAEARKRKREQFGKMFSS